jgi:hypothetical protein
MAKKLFMFIAVAMMNAVLCTVCAQKSVISANDLPKTSAVFAVFALAIPLDPIPAAHTTKHCLFQAREPPISR